MKNVLRAGHAFCVEVEPLALSRVGNQMQAGICVLVVSWPNGATMRST